MKIGVVINDRFKFIVILRPEGNRVQFINSALLAHKVASSEVVHFASSLVEVVFGLRLFNDYRLFLRLFPHFTPVFVLVLVAGAAVIVGNYQQALVIGVLLPRLDGLLIVTHKFAV